MSWNTRDLLRACLTSIRACEDAAQCKVIVVDNASADGSAAMVQEEFPDVRLLANEDNIGFASANAQAFEHVETPFWLLLNSDAEVRPGAVEHLVRMMNARPAAGLVTARLLNADGTLQHCGQRMPAAWRMLVETSRLHKLLPPELRAKVLLGHYWEHDRDLELDWTWGTALLARTAAVRDVGTLDPSFFLYGEDLEWCLRMRREGWQVWFCHAAEVLHHGGASSESHVDDLRRMKMRSDGIMRALAMHRPRWRVAALRRATMVALRADLASTRLRGGDTAPIDLALRAYAEVTVPRRAK